VRVAAISDLHFGQDACAAQVGVDQLASCDADIRIVAGDLGSSKKSILNALSTLKQCPKPLLIVAGNHDLWVTEHDEDDSEERFKWFVAKVKEFGFWALDEEPFVAGEVAFVGSVGWYDYSFRRRDPPTDGLVIITKDGEKRWAQLTDKDYSAKFISYILASDLAANPYAPPETRVYQTGWNDGRFIRWRFSDKAFLRRCIKHLKRQLNRVKKLNTVVAVTHHIPFREFILTRGDPRWDFNNAFLGAESLGALLLRYRNVRYSICGHTHHSSSVTIPRRNAPPIAAFNVSGRPLRPTIIDIEP